VGAFTAFGPLTLLVLIAAMLLAVLLGFRMAGLVAGPVTRLAEEATASLPDDVVIIPETSDEVSQIDEALAALRTGLRQTTDELGGSREELRVTKERLDDQERLVLTDGLTGVWNRRYLEMALSDALQRGQRRKRPFAVLMVDLDHFKKVNDTYGHQRGDDVLVELCRRIRSSLRTHLDVLARYGGEEFVILLPETNPQGAFIVAQKIRRLVRAEPFGEGEDGLRVTVSIGLSSYPGDGEDHEQLLAIADANLYRAKGAGRDRVMTGATSPES
jgi:diguanylate cyclase (GGDEF)-like protein